MRHAYLLLPLTVLVIGLPLLGAAWYGMPVGTFLEFPPRSLYVDHWPFLWPAFVLLAAVIAVPVALAALVLLVTWWRHRRAPAPARRPFPAWGWWGLAAGLVLWAIAWTRLPWLAWFQPHTFTPLWLAYIVVVNALTWRRTGRCLLTHRRDYLLALFPLSAAFWWYFEFLNRFVQNWFYREAWHYSALGYFLAASIAFGTVLPAVMSTAEWFGSLAWFDRGFAAGWRIRPCWPRLWAALVLAGAACCLFAIGIQPNLLYPFLWGAPLLALIALQALAGRPHFLSPLAKGDWRPLFAAALAALVCGFWWEMWNSQSLAKWFYRVPLVHAFQLFEMPVLGYAGYLPFGWECAAVAGLLGPTDDFAKY